MAVVAALAGSGALGQSHSVWVEGEDAVEKNVTQHNWYGGAVKRGEFSDNAFLHHYDNSAGAKDGSALYKFEVPADGEYMLWLRINPVGGPAYSVKFDGEPAVKIDLSDVRDRMNVADNDAPDMRFLGWVRSGPHKLRKGSHSMSVTLGGEGIKNGYIDCFLLTTGRFTPSGSRKPTAVGAGAGAAGGAGGGAGAGGQSNSVWVEGEDAAEKKVTQHNWYGGAVKRGEFSDNAFLHHYDNSAGAADGSALYKFEVPADGDYTLWMRLNPVGGPVYSVKFDGGPAMKIDLSDVRDRVNVANNDAPDMRFLGWARSGPHKLRKGSHTMGVTLGGEGIKSGYIDCFLLTTERFTPSGSRKPVVAGADAALPANPGSWAFVHPDDEYTREALFDLRHLLDDVAGSKGWIKASPDGGFVRGNGSPIRFWALNSGVQSKPVDELEEFARFISKRGVNMVRNHGSLVPPKDRPITEANAEEIDRIHKMVAVMKKHGVYSTISPFWAISPAEKRYGLHGRDSGNLMGLLFWDKTMQGIYKGWIKELFTRPNPYDPRKTPLKDDPAFAVFQIQNEDSMLFWTMQSVQNDASRKTEWNALQALFKTWLANNKLPAGTELDFRFWNIDAGKPAGAGAPSESLKLSMRFAAETMRAFNAEIERYIRQEIKCPVLVNAGNWTVASIPRLLDHERWSYDSNQVTGLNRYFDAGHYPRDNNDHTVGYLVAKGQYYANGSAVRENWRSLPIAVKQVKGKPFIVSESTWVPPNLYQSEGPFLIAAYSSLTGVDAYYWFAYGNPGYDPSIVKWQAANPAITGGFPAAAWLFHKGYVKQGAPAVDEKRALAGDMWELNTPVITEDASYDPNRPGTKTASNNIEGGAPYGAFFIGPVLVEYGADPKQTKLNLGGQDPAALTKGVIKSNTREITLDAEKGYCLLDTPKAQGATGFLKGAGALATSNLAIVSGNDYATVLAVSLDDQPLAVSGKILLQVTTTCRPYGWSDSPATRDGKPVFRINDTGNSPWSVANTDVTITLDNATIKTAIQTDANFYPATKLPLERSGSKMRVKLPPNAMYVVLGK